MTHKQKLSDAELENILDELDELDNFNSNWSYDFPYKNILLTKKEVFNILEESKIIDTIKHADMVIITICHPTYSDGKIIIGLNGEGILLYEEEGNKMDFKTEVSLTQEEKCQVLIESQFIYSSKADENVRIIHPNYGPAILIKATTVYPQTKKEGWLIFYDELMQGDPLSEFRLSCNW